MLEQVYTFALLEQVFRLATTFFETVTVTGYFQLALSTTSAT
jgi:hypothetical protein